MSKQSSQIQTNPSPDKYLGSRAASPDELIQHHRTHIVRAETHPQHSIEHPKLQRQTPTNGPLGAIVTIVLYLCVSTIALSQTSIKGTIMTIVLSQTFVPQASANGHTGASITIALPH